MGIDSLLPGLAHRSGAHLLAVWFENVEKQHAAGAFFTKKAYF